MKKLLLTAFIASTLIAPLNASEEFEGNRYLYAMHKFKGACDFFSTMVNLQKGLKMEGGDDFVRKLLRYEAARINYSLEEYGSTCVTSREVAADPQVLNIEDIPSHELNGLLALSEMTGYCGLYKSAADVVSSEEEQSFLVRFLSTELAKSGTDLDQFMNMCELSNSEYLKITGQE